MYWSMYKTEHLTEDHELSQRFPNAVSHDGVNTLFVDVPSDTTDLFFLPNDIELEELVMVAGGFLVSQDTNPMLGTIDQFKKLFDTPHHRLWCGNYEDKEVLEKDHELVFGVGVDRRKSLEVLVSESQTAIKELVTP
jgi:hypothetical protein